MTGDRPIQRLLTDNILFFSVPLCAILGIIKFDDLYKTLGFCLFVCAFCIIYKLYAKVTNYKKDKTKISFKAEFLSVSGFIITAGLGIFAEVPNLRWLFLIGIVFAVNFSDILSALMSAFAYVLIITIFTNVTPEFVANSFFTAVILIILTQYYSDFLSVFYSIVTLMSFESAFFVIMHGLRTDQLVTSQHITDACIISGCVIMGWLINKYVHKKTETSEPLENADGINMEEDSISAKDVILNNIKSTESMALTEKKDYSYLLNDNIEIYNKLMSNEKLFDNAKRTSKFVKEMTKLIEGNVSLAETGAFYAECGRLISNNYIKEGLILAKENNFPSEVTAFIKEHNFKLGYPKSRETAITMIVCKLSTTIAYLESKGINHSLVHIVDGVMDSCLMSGRLDASGLLLNEYKFIKDYLMEEARTGYDYFSGK